MNDSAIKNYCIWARNELIAGVEARMRLYGVAEGAEPAGATAVGGRALSPEETGWRDALLRAAAEEGFEHLRDRAAYTWFNRIAAVRYMEVHDFLPSRVRMFTRPAADGSWELGSQAADEALDVEIDGADPVRIAELKQAGEDGPLFRYLFLAQCAELSECLSGVFQPVDACMALLLPANLMEPDGVIGRMVGDIPEEDWVKNVQVLGWMYQYYNSEVKDAFFASKAKVTPDTIGPATQLFTPDWIVRYMVQNSLGRLWMLNNPESPLRDEMEYYIEPDEEHEDFIKIGGPEDISLCDPACGSGHILVYAFELLSRMYLERGYREREIPELVLSKNLHGMEIDPRAAQIARLALAMCARGMDRRFFGRGVQADIAVLTPVALGEGDVPHGSALEKRKDLVDALAHLDEVGSLLAPGEGDLAAIREAIDLTGADGLFGSNSKDKLQRALSTCETLTRRHDCVVANPPYMGSSSFGPFMSKWVKKNYPDVKSDLCTCFIERNLSLAKVGGFASLVTSDTCMYLSSFVAMRTSLVDNNTILTFVDTRGTNAHPDVFDANAIWVLRHGRLKGYEGSYFKLNHRIPEKAGALFEAIKNPDCGWFYRRDAETFKQIPGTPIAYWASDALLDAFGRFPRFDSCVTLRQGLKTGENDRFLRLWHEVPLRSACLSGDNSSMTKWFPYNKGGFFRKWYGNRDYVVNWCDDGYEIKNFKDSKGKLRSRPQSLDYQFKEAVSWSLISSGVPAFRYSPAGSLFDAAGSSFFGSTDLLLYAQGLANSVVFTACASFLSSTLTFEVGQLGRYPFALDIAHEEAVVHDVRHCLEISRSDYDSFEISWDFKRHPLV
ncbi:BREX-1 system adenine-specific DNA-methyltransferase PglX [Collinsella aerofaciens]|uniref:BREX-1 system adenine-specific DNA-methyltransferase PglX n=1 Tax=Collinsella aerofaciens TaxID=74426 RepID=UPI001D020329|nr:BREX-1 system adenine-specific DNA-methyltransferase PglX [Collinsella aerofaciens]MCB5365403.1 BREX-1 system adenine-specific DNA-methyltransferase PglX [Collinsella aerofaciens]MCB5367763.1 BREX-1 system adenine-specific DNA-methyltransferase PglX [Collinsella aerofaciens]